MFGSLRRKRLKGNEGEKRKRKKGDVQKLMKSFNWQENGELNKNQLLIINFITYP